MNAIDILGDPERPYLVFNEKNEVLCGSRCKNRARDVLIDVSDKPPYTNSEGSQYQHIKVGDQYALVWAAKCGVHNRRGSYGSILVDADIFVNDRLFDWDTIRQAVENDAAKKRERDERDRALEAEERMKIANLTEGDFRIEVQPEWRGGCRWVINGRTYSDWTGVAWVELTGGADIWHVTTGGYSGYVGRGTGSPILARIIARILIEAADKAEAANLKGEE